MNKKSKQRPYLASHQRSWIFGRHAVREILDAGRWPILELFLSEDLPAETREDAVAKGRLLGAEVTAVSHKRIRELCGATEHQGFLARMGPFPYATLNEAFSHESENGHAPLLVLLDAIRDPHNFGAIIRSAAALGATAIIIGEESQAPVNSQVARASAGALNRVPVAKTDTLLDMPALIKAQGMRIVATAPRAERALWECDLRGPACLVLGNEAAGIRPELLALCDEQIRIPSSGAVDSLNVAAAATAVLYESMRQRCFVQDS